MLLHCTQIVFFIHGLGVCTYLTQACYAKKCAVRGGYYEANVKDRAGKGI